ncbi:MAG: N-acetyl-gamma-glutamyl-phosphate reductase, partial [Alphaproteobacteria bacterium]|nr:N-acetyl-gamma-glutamyl-phosphate reductase [Alphaproteobacteria bacterium]
MSTKKIRVGILGASGYTGAELVRILSKHPNVEIALLTADRRAGERIDAVFPHLGGLNLPGLISLEDVEWGGVELDVVFCGLPHGTTQDVIKGLFHATGHSILDEFIDERVEDQVDEIQGEVKVIDLSADFRLRDLETYAEWYGHEHYAPDLQPRAVYGLTEFYRGALVNSSLVAVPGCYPTGALLPLVPLLEAEQIETHGIIIDSKTGVTGAGRAPKEGMLHAEVSEGMHAYGVASHRHGPEIDQELSVAAGEPITVTFTPHLAPMNRGILSTIYVTLKGGATAEDLHATLSTRYRDEPFVRVLDMGATPATRHVRGSNNTHIGVVADRSPGRAIIVSAIDNLVKCAAGQAV